MWPFSSIRIRSDVERKRLFGIDTDADSSAGIEQGIYSAEASSKTYERLKQLAGRILDAGFSVIVDAAFLKHQQRQPFMELAEQKQSAFIILEFTASEEVLKQRIMARTKGVSDADLSVLEHQLATTKPLHQSELPHVIKIDTEQAFDAETLLEKIAELSGSDMKN